MPYATTRAQRRITARRHAAAAAHSRPRRVLALVAAMAATLGAGLMLAAAPAATTPTFGATLSVGGLWLGLCAVMFAGLACHIGQPPRR